MTVCFVDLDGVLVDFVRGAFALHRRELPMRDVQWGFPAQLGFAGVNDPNFWQGMGEAFWASLAWTAEGMQLLAGAEKIFGEENVALLTSPCNTPGGVEGKVAWIKKHLPEYARRFFVGPPKHLIAGPGKVLVDDHEGNTDKFRAAGGKVVLVPRPWNPRKPETDEQGNFDVGLALCEIAAAARA